MNPAFKYILIVTLLCCRFLLCSGNLNFSILKIDSDLDLVTIQLRYNDSSKPHFRIRVEDINFDWCSDNNGTLNLKKLSVNTSYVATLHIFDKCKSSFINIKLRTESFYLRFEIPPLSTFSNTILPSFDSYLQNKYEISINSRINGDLKFSDNSNIYFNGNFAIRIENDKLIARPYCSIYEDGGDFTNLKGETSIILYERQGYHLTLDSIQDYYMTSGRGEFHIDPGLLIQNKFDNNIPDYQNISNIGKFHLTIKDDGNSILSFTLLKNTLITIKEYFKCPQ